MEVALKIRRIDGISDISHYELMVDDMNYRFHSEITYKIHTIHDFLFGQTKILIMSNGFLFKNLRGLCVIRNINIVTNQKKDNSNINDRNLDNINDRNLDNINLDNINDRNLDNILLLPIIDASFLYKTEYFADLSAHHKGKIELSYTFKYVEEDLEYQMAKNSFVYKAIDFLLAPKKSSLVKNLKNLLNEAAKGSPKCKINILFGVYLMDQFMSELNHKLTYNIEFSKIQQYNVCIVEKRRIPSSNYNCNELEGAVLRYKYKYSLQNISELQFKDKFKIIKVEKPNEVKGNKTKEVNYSFMALLKYIFPNDKEEISKYENKECEECINREEECKEEISKYENKECEEEISKYENKEREEEINKTSLNLNKTSSSSSLNPFKEMKWIKNLQIKEKFNHELLLNLLLNNNNVLKTLETLLSNEGFVCAHKIFIEDLLNVFYFALGPYGNTWPTTFLERRQKIKPSQVPNPHKRAILEILNIQEDLLLFTLFGDVDVPDFIIFFDKIEKRLVLSFKGTSTSNETLHDLDCEYTTFYEGLTHKGIKRLAVAFIENETGKIITFLKLFNTNELLITGHSLGGSLASIISIIIHREGVFKDIKINTPSGTKEIKITTISFSSPPIVSFALVDQPIFTVNYGNDVIPRLCYGSVVEMRYVCCSLGTSKSIDSLEDIRKHLCHTQLFPKLYHPGKVYQLRRIRVVKKGKIHSILMYKGVGVEYYENLLIVKHSPKHHMINHIAKVLKECIRDYQNIIF